MESAQSEINIEYYTISSRGHDFPLKHQRDNPYCLQIQHSKHISFSSSVLGDAVGMHKLLIFWIFSHSCMVHSKQHAKKEKLEDLEVSYSDKIYYKYINPIGPYGDDETKKAYTYKDTIPHSPIPENNLLNALILSADLQLKPKHQPPNHPDLPPINPFLALLLSQYGRYLPLYGPGRGIYAYQASNDFHNNKPFGSYKVYEDRA